MFILALWISIAITIGKPNAIYFYLSKFGRRSTTNMRPIKLMRPESLYIGIVSFGYSVFYFAILGYLAYQIWPNSYSGIDSSEPSRILWEFFYFSFVTVTTLGYGDITPVAVVSQAMTVLELCVGMFYVLFVFGSFVSFYFSRLEED